MVVVVGVQVGRLVASRLLVFGFEVGGERPSLGRVPGGGGGVQCVVGL